MTKLILVSNTEWYLYNFRLSLARHLREQGYEVVLVSPPGRFAPLLEQAGFRWVEWRVGRQTLAPWQELAAAFRLARIYREERPALVHHHTIKPVLYGTLAARWAGVSAIVNSIPGRGYVFLGSDPKARLLRPLVKSFYRMVLKSRQSAVIFENTTDQQYFVDEKLVSASRVWLIEGVGVDPQIFSPTPEPDGIPVILFASRMLWDKGVGVLVEAARLLRGRVAARVALAGEPDPGNPATVDDSTLRGWADEGVVEWWGWRGDMPAVYASSHIVTLPTMYGEGVPTVLLEAAACGRPLVASDVPGCRHVVEDGVNGLIVPQNDPAGLAAALEKLAVDPSLRGRMGAAGRRRVLDQFTTDRVNAATLDVYRRVLNESSRNSESR